MKLQYQLTAEDYGEANRMHMRLRPWMLIWLLDWLAVVSLVSDLSPDVSQTATPGSPSLWTNLVLPLLPWLLLLLLIWLFIFRALRRNWRKPWLRPGPNRENPAFVVGAFALQGAVLVLLFTLALRAERAATTDPRQSPLLNVLLPLLPIACMVGFLAFLMRRFRGVFNRGWESQPHMHRPYIAEIDETSLRLSEPLSHHEYRWEYFPGWIETTNNFVIYVSPLSFHLIPKRAFADAAARAQFVELLRRVISEQTGAFPVGPSGARPLPAIPLSS
jgi:hypothetical protein